MPGVLIIARKEFKDHVSDQTFLLCFAALLVVMVGGALFMIQTVQWNNFRFPNEVDYWRFHDVLITEMVTGQLSSIGVLIAVAMSINTIQKERTEGSLRVILSYPIYRDNLFIGKLLGGVLVLSLVAAVSIAISFSLLVFYLSIPLTLDFLMRIIFTTFMGIMLLVFFLCVGMVVSSIFKDSSSVLLGLVLIVALFRYETFEVILVAAINLLSYFGLRFQKPGFYPATGVDRAVWNDPFYRTFCRLSPTESYLKLSERLFHFVKGMFWDTYGNSNVLRSFQDQLFENLDLVAVQILFTVAAVTVCYVVSARREL